MSSRSLLDTQGIGALRVSDDGRRFAYLGTDGMNLGWITSPSDIDRNGSVDLNDLAALLSNYGCVGATCIGDLNNDGQTDLNDLARLLSDFGKLF